MAEHGIQGVNEAVREILREDYEYLRGVFHGEPAVVPKTDVIPVVTVPTGSAEPDSTGVAAAPTPAPTPSESSMKKVRVRVMKAKTEETEAPAPAPVVPEVVQAEPLNILVPLPSTAASSTVSSPLSQPQAQRSAQDIKKFQKLAEETKRRELKEKGISVEQVLTKENLQKWIVEEKHTFAWVAREKAGCPETQVSSIAKSFGIQSPISIRRGLLVSKRKP